MVSPVLTAKPGVKPKKVRQHFRLYEDELRVVGTVKVAGKDGTLIITDHLPAVQDGDTIRLDLPRANLMGLVEVLDHRHARVSGGEYRTALAVRLIEDKNEIEEAR